MKNIQILFFTILFIACSCSQKQEQIPEEKKYEKENLAFTLPIGWSVKQDSINNEVRYLELDKVGNYQIENTIGITIYRKPLSFDSTMNDQINKLKFYYQKVNFKVTEDKIKSKLAGFEVLVSSYVADDTKNAKVYGDIYIFEVQKNTVIVQAVDLKNKSDRSDFNKIFKGFIIK